MKHFYFLILLLLCSSCQYFEKPVPSEKELLQKELKTINWKEVDEYPTLANCEKIPSKQERQHCFFESMNLFVQQKLNTDTLNKICPKIDTIAILVTIYPDAQMKFRPQFPKDSLAFDSKQLDSILKARLINFPTIKPALKRGLPVKTQFVIPVILKGE